MKDHQASGWFEQGRQNARAAAQQLTRDEARRIAASDGRELRLAPRASQALTLSGIQCC